jgi:hypothetical protein
VSSVTEEGQPVEVELVWRSLAVVNKNYSASVHLLGRDGGRIGQLDVLPGGGRYPTSYWQPGQLLKDQLAVPVSAPLDERTGARVVLTVYDRETGSNVEAKNPQGGGVYPLVLGTTELAFGPQRDCDDGVPGGVFGDRIRMVSASPRPDSISAGSSLMVNLIWCRLAPTPVDYNVFVHLGRPGEPPIAQHDSQPRGGQYPTTAWARGELVSDAHQVTVGRGVTPGSYRLLVGLYNPTTGARLTTPGGKDVVDLGAVAVTAPPPS